MASQRLLTFLNILAVFRGIKLFASGIVGANHISIRSPLLSLENWA